MNVRVKLFALAREKVGSDHVLVELPNEATVAMLRQHLAKQFPPLAPLIPRMMMAIDAQYADDNQTIAPDADVACILPVSGG